MESIDLPKSAQFESDWRGLRGIASEKGIVKESLDFKFLFYLEKNPKKLKKVKYLRA